MDLAATESSLLQQIMARYENEENDFLQEMEAMQQQCANTDTSDEVQEETSTPVLGTLCNLVGEISQLRKENRKLRRRLFDSSTHPRSTNQVSSSSSTSRRAGVVNRVNAFLEKNSRRSSTAFLPRLITTAVNAGSRNCLMSSGSGSGIFNQKSNTMEARHGARERLSSPSQKDSLTISSYSADLSSDTLSSYRRKCTPRASTTKPPLVLPEVTDIEMTEENIFHEVALPKYARDRAQNERPDGYQTPANRSRRSMTRRSSRSQLSATDFSSISDHTSPSSASASSSVDPNDHMTSSRSSFLELIGLRRKREKLPPVSTMQGDPAYGFAKSISAKKRKRKNSGNDSCNPLNNEKRYSAAYMRERGHHQSGGNFEGSELENWGNDVGDVAASADRKMRRNSQVYSNASEGASELRKHRPKSMYLDPTKIPQRPSSLRNKTRSCKSVVNSEQRSGSRETSQGHNEFEADNELLQHYRHENGLLSNEVQVLKARNNRLIDQLREKSMQLSVVQTQKNALEEEVESLKRKDQFNELVNRLSLQNRFAQSFEASFSSLEEKLYNFKTQIHAMSDAFKAQQSAINASFREHSISHEACLEQVERLQRENFSLLQLQASELEMQDTFVRQKIDLMPSYDALYSFTMGIVKKLGQLRKMLVGKSCRVNQAELEVMNIQSSLLLTHAQVERQRLKLGIMSVKPFQKRPSSFHGDSLLDKMAKSELCFLLPLKLHGSRVQQQRKFQNSSNIDGMVETNEQNIEVEFLRLFDYARCLSKICEDSPQKRLKQLPVESVIHYRNGRGTVSPMNSPLINDRKAICGETSKLSPIVSHRMGHPRDHRRGLTKSPHNFIGKRPMSWMDPTRSNFIKPEDDFGFLTKDNTPNSSPLLNLHKLSSIFGRNKSSPSNNGLSAQDINWRSPSTTPILTRRVPLLGSPKSSPKQLKERRLVQHTSLQNRENAYDSRVQPLYDTPPRYNLTLSETGSSDYNTIGSFQVPVTPVKQQEPCSASIFSRGGSTSLERACVDCSATQCGLMKRPSGVSIAHRPMPSAPPISLIHSAVSRLPQPSSSSGLGNSSGMSLRRRDPITKRESTAITRKPVVEQIPSSLQSSPLPMRQVPLSNRCQNMASRVNTSESPSFPPRFVHNNQPNQYGDVSRKPEFQSKAPESSQYKGNQQPTGVQASSRLPKLASGGVNATAAAKKAGTSWLSRLRLNSARK